MSLGSNLSQARKKSGLSQEEVAEKLGVSRQTISKWELDETLPDIRQSKKLSTLYHLTLDELIEVDFDVKEIERVIEHTSQAAADKVDWTKVWAKQYPVLASASTNMLHRCARCSKSCGRTMDTANRMPAWCSRTSFPRSGRTTPDLKCAPLPARIRTACLHMFLGKAGHP